MTFWLGPNWGGREREPPDALKRFLTYSHMINNPHSGASWAVSGRFSLEVKNVVYAIQCRCCGIMYVGETGACLRGRLQQHLYAVRAGEPCSTVAIHFREHTEEALSIMGLQANPGWSVGRSAEEDGEDLDRQTENLYANGSECACLRNVCGKYVSLVLYLYIFVMGLDLNNLVFL